MKSKPKVIAIVGPTASGKTDYSIDLAKKINGEIISADSRLVYKGLDIATAKPTSQERQIVAHHLIDIVEPEVDYSVANFYDDAKKEIKEILKKNNTPIVVGGTGLYFRILLEDFDLPRVPANNKLRDELSKLDTQKLHEMLKTMDFACAQKIHHNNKVKIIRAIEVCKELNSTMTQNAGKKEPEFNVEWIGLDFKNRDELYDRINNRVEKMIEMGMIDETKFLLNKHGRIQNIVNTIGYQEIIRYFDKELSLKEAIELIKQNSRHYAKRQLTWFRRNKDINWILM